jgi:aminoglycoside 6'-N-acetyltransferase I
MKIINITKKETKYIKQAAQLLVDAFREHWPDAWPTLKDAQTEVKEMLEENRIFRAAVDDDGNLLGMIGGIPEYDGNVWELHPLAVQPNAHDQGIGTTLVKDFEEQVRARGGLTIMLGTDDEDEMTTLAGVNVYEDLWEKVKTIQNLKRHPFEFYMKCGFVITGVVPDANGPGKPDIIMSKRVEKK